MAKSELNEVMTSKWFEFKPRMIPVQSDGEQNVYRITMDAEQEALDDVSALQLETAQQ